MATICPRCQQPAGECLCPPTVARYLATLAAVIVAALVLLVPFRGAVEPAGTPHPTAATTVAVPTPDTRTVVERVCTTPGDDIRRSVRVVVDGRQIDLWCGTRYWLDAGLCVTRDGDGEHARPCTEETR